MENIINNAEQYIAIITAFVLVSRVVAKAIPDDAPGVLGVVRRILKVIGAYNMNRKTKNDPLFRSKK